MIEQLCKVASGKTGREHGVRQVTVSQLFKSDSDLIDELRVIDAVKGRMRQWCIENGVDRSTVSALITGRLGTVPTHVSIALGYRMKRVYVRADNADRD